MNSMDWKLLVALLKQYALGGPHRSPITGLVLFVPLRQEESTVKCVACNTSVRRLEVQ